MGENGPVSLPKMLSTRQSAERSGSVEEMSSFLGLLLHVLASPFKSQARLQAEIVFLHHQLNLLRRRRPAKPRLTTTDRLLFVWLSIALCRRCSSSSPTRSCDGTGQVSGLIGAGSRVELGGRSKVPIEVRGLIRRMSVENPLWGAPPIHGELLKLGIEVAQSTVAKYMAKRRPGSSQTWKTFLRDHAAGIDAWTSSWFRRSTFGCCLCWSTCGMIGDA